MQDTGFEKIIEKAIIVGVVLPRLARWEVEEHLSELEMLSETAGVEVVDRVIQERGRIHPALFIGSGKVEELKLLVSSYKVKTVIFDQDLTPAQSRNLEKALDAKIIDRSALILDIFASHARTRTSKTQVELAQLEYFLPRLTRQWTHLSRQVGGIGTKGPGETQLETDRRLIRRRIETLKRELAKIDRQRTIRREGRKSAFKAALVGYTNVGKSTIMNLLSGSSVLVEDQLFATLDSTVRRVSLDSRYEILLSDTVGFIRKLPHHLVESFKSTLDEAINADLLIHVVDISHPAYHDQIVTVNEVLKDLGAAEKPVLMVFNKIDQLAEKGLMVALKGQYPHSVFISATRQIRTDELRQAMIEFVEHNFVDESVTIPLSQAGLVHKVHRLATVSSEKYDERSVTLTFRCLPENRSRILRLLGQDGQANGAGKST